MTLIDKLVAAQAKAKKDWRAGLPPGNSICIVCACRFYASPGHIKHGWNKFCSLDCRTKRWQKENSPNWKGAAWNRKCEACGGAFRIKPSHVEYETGRFCSFKCSKTRYPIKPIRECEHCGKSFEIFSCWAKKGKGRFCSKECAVRGFRGHKENKYNSGKRVDLGNMYFRSQWEANWARYLNWLKENRQIKGWLFEPDTFEFPYKRGTRFYLPDFKIENNNGSIEYHEVKGYMDDKSRIKLRRMAKHHPHVKIIVIDKRSYTDMAKKIGPALPGWETSRHVGRAEPSLLLKLATGQPVEPLPAKPHKRKAK